MVAYDAMIPNNIKHPYRSFKSQTRTANLRSEAHHSQPASVFATVYNHKNPKNIDDGKRKPVCTIFVLSIDKSK